MPVQNPETPAPPPPVPAPVPEFLPSPFDWIEIPAGKITLLENNYDDSYLKKGEAQTFELPPFAIAKYLITNAQYAKFIEADGYHQKKWWKDAGWQIKEEKSWNEPRFWRQPQWNKPDYPVVAVSWFEALAFCEWLSEVKGKKFTLPTEQQWQRAAQGDLTTAYPWGDQFDKERCNFDTKGTTPVKQFEGKGDSPFKVTDMSGNVWEWCATDFRHGAQSDNPKSEPVVLRGGSWTVFLESLLRVNRRFLESPIARNTDIGFRIVQA